MTVTMQECLLILMVISFFSGSPVETCIHLEKDVNIPSNDRQYILERLVSEGMSSIDAPYVIIELEHFYTAVKAGSKGSPSGAVDQAWHAHILNTPMYFEFTENVFGKYLHHAPYWSGSRDKDRSNAYFDLVELGVKNLNRTIWFDEVSMFSTINPFLHFSSPRSERRTLCEL